MKIIKFKNLKKINFVCFVICVFLIFCSTFVIGTVANALTLTPAEKEEIFKELAGKEYYTGVTRPTEYKITDSGPFKQKYDDFTWNGSFLTASDFKNHGYQYAFISVEFEMKEKDKGYQQVFLYPYGATGYNDFIHRVEFEYGGDSLVKEYGKVTVYFKATDLNRFVYDSNGNMGCTIRYGATGGGADTWYNRECTINVYISKENNKFPINTAGGNVKTNNGYNNP